jgi:beta-galactosidase
MNIATRPLCFLLLSGFVSTLHSEEPSPEVWKSLDTGMMSSFTQAYKAPVSNLSITGHKMSIAGIPYERGIGTHAPSELVFNLDGKRRHFVSDVGVDDLGGKTGSVVFKVLLDGKEAFDSGLISQGEPAKKVDLDVTGCREMRLVTTDGGNGAQGDHADWANAKVDDVIVPIPVPVFSTAGFFPVKGSVRSVTDFDPGWRFHKGDVTGAEAPGYDDSAWEAANLPHGLEILGENESGCRNYQGPAWYRKKFDADPKGGKLFLYFEAVMGKCTVWVNGKKMAEHFGGYLPFVIDAGPALNADGKNNIVAVRADNSDDPTYPPGKPQNNLDFTYLGGIYRDVYMIRTPDLHVTLPELSKTAAGGGVFVGVKDVKISDAAVTNSTATNNATTLNGAGPTIAEAANLEIRTELANESTSIRKITVKSILETAEGKELTSSSTNVEIPPGGTLQITQNLDPKNVRLWHPDDPYLHFIRTEILENGSVSDTLRTRFGIRLFEMRGHEGFFVNKKYIGHKLSGVNRHQDYPYIGNALPKSGQWRDVKLLREGGCTIIRAAHYPQSPAFYDACDEFGMLTTTANPGWQFFNTKDPGFEQLNYEDTRGLVRRDRNHPSMLLWETSLNETPSQPANLLHEMNRIANEEYPFPGFYTVADINEAKKGGLNFYYHGGDPKVNSFTREYGDGGEVDNFFSHNASTRVKREWGEGPLLQQAVIRARDLDGIFATSPIRLGAALWCGIDHQRGYHPDPFWGGLLDGVRVPRYAYHLFKSQYGPDDKLTGIATGPFVKIAHELTQVSGADVIVYSNCDEVRLTWLGKVLATQKPDPAYTHLPHPPFTFKNAFDFAILKKDWRTKTEKIEMVAEGLIAGKVVAREVKKYPERTSGIILTVDDQGAGLTADGSDFVPLRATIVDNKGVPKVLASEYVYFEVEGPGEIIGGTGTQSNPAKTEFGTATALLRATTKPGLIKVKAVAKGLAAGEVFVASSASVLPLNYDAAYASASKPADNGNALVLQGGAGGGDADVNKLKDKVQRLQLELTSKEQDLMELRSKLGK